ncbi:hypothetical protein RvY_14302 [Ramazzottius varieornatus]|uniref:Uncharacterized protein n=1 Tax=Ramazzottius varieornatus TaxID=947166 RepID=A0A1D1VY44_RAMVA|nr:hypothetical protein RvY_14302 [Ramazzottius varieornatus]
MNRKRSQKSSSSEQPNGPYRNSVSYGRWHTSLAVKRGADGQSSTSSVLNQETPSHLSKYFYNCSSQTQPDTELAFEALRKFTIYAKEKKVKMTASASHCIAHIKDLKRLNQAYLGADAEVIRGYINKDRSELPEIDLAASQHCSDLRILCVKNEILDKSPELQPKPQSIVKPENPYKKFAQDQPSSSMQTGALDRVLEKEVDKDFVKPNSILRKSSKSKLKKAAAGLKISTQQVFWGNANSQNGHPAAATQKKESKMPTTLSELVSGSDFVFNPKYADKLGKLPEFRRQLIPANALPVRAGPFRVQSVASLAVSNFNQNATPSKIIKKY